MNPQQIVMQMLMQQVQSQNPQAFQVVNQAINSGANPMQFMKQVMGNVSPQQMQDIMTQAKQFGVPDEVLQQIQNIK